MRRPLTGLAVATTLALAAAPAVALPPQAPSNAGTDQAPSSTPPSNQGTAHMPSTPGPNASANAKRKAYGKLCQGESKKHVDGQKGTPFSQCVTAMARLATGEAKNPRTACKSLSKKHVEGEKGTPFSQCVSAGAKLLKNQDQQQ